MSATINTLARPYISYTNADRVDVVLTNPPFGGAEEAGIESNFPAEFRTRETADLFLVLIMRLLKPGGRCGIVLPDGTLFGEGVKTTHQKTTLATCNLHTIIRLPTAFFALMLPSAQTCCFLSKANRQIISGIMNIKFPPDKKRIP